MLVLWMKEDEKYESTNMQYVYKYICKENTFV